MYAVAKVSATCSRLTKLERRSVNSAYSNGKFSLLIIQPTVEVRTDEENILQQIWRPILLEYELQDGGGQERVKDKCRFETDQFVPGSPCIVWREESKRAYECPIKLFEAWFMYTGFALRYIERSEQNLKGS